MGEAAGGLRRPVVIGVGNRERGDDAIGPLVVEALGRRSAGITARICGADLSTLPLLWEREDDVVIVDATRSPRDLLGRIHEVDPAELVSSIGMSTHGLTVSDAIQLARRLGRSPARLRVIGISGHDFGAGPMSSSLERQVDRLADELLVRIAPDGGSALADQAPSTD